MCFFRGFVGQHPQVGHGTSVLMRFLYWLRRLLGLLPPARWEDGKISTDPRYAAWYNATVAWVRVVNPEAIQQPDFRVTVRIYDRWPKGYEYNWGKVLPPNQIEGDTGGTLCLAKSKRNDTAVIVEECQHAITGIGDHPQWLFP